MKRASLVTYISFAAMIAIGIAAALFRASSQTAEAAPLATLNVMPSSSAEIATVTEYATPTATLKSIETLQAELDAAQDAEYQARLDLANMIDAHAQVTLAHEENVIEIAKLTETARSLEVKAAELTATVIPAMATEAEAVRQYQIQQNEFAERYPALVREKAEAEAYAKTADAINATEIFLRFVFGFAVIVLLSLLVFVVIYRWRRDEVSSAGEEVKLVDLGEMERQQRQREMFFRPAVNAQDQPVQRRMQVEIPCPLDEFLQFAEGLIRLNQKLTFASWRGSPVYKYLNALRHWMQGEGFAEAIPNHTDEMVITADGEKFLTESLAADEPIQPYYCKKINEEKENQS